MPSNIHIASNRFTASGLPLILPTPQAPGVVAAFDARTVSVPDGADVRSWNANVGTGQFAPAAAAPSLARTTTGAPYVQFDRTGGELLSLTMPRNVPHTVAILARVPTDHPPGLYPIEGASTVTGVFIGIASSGLPRLYAGTALDLPIGGLDGDWHAWICVFDGTSGVLRVDGSEVTGPIGATAASATAHTLGRYQNGADAIYSSVDVALWARWNRALTPAERVAEAANLRGMVRL